MLNLLPKTTTNNQKEKIGQLYGCSLSAVLTEYCLQKNNPKLIITQDNYTAHQLLHELNFFFSQEHNKQIILFPDWETLPYDQFSPHQDIISERLKILNQLQQSSNIIVIASITTLMHRICPKNFINNNSLLLKCHDNLNIDKFRLKLESSGYYFVNTVLEHGEFSVRGSIIDLYPMGHNYPFRIELFDDEIESLRTFDPDTQLTIEKINEINILPAREFPLDKESITLFRNNFRNQFNINPSNCPIYEAVSQGKYTGGIEYYLPFFFPNTETIFDYLPENTDIFLAEEMTSPAEQFYKELTNRYEQLSNNITKPILKPTQCFISPIDVFTIINKYKKTSLYHKPNKGINLNIEKAKSLPISRKSEYPLENLVQYLSEPNKRFLIVVESTGRQETLIEMLKQHNISIKKQASWHNFLNDLAPINITIGPLIYGAEFIDNKISIIVEAQIFGEQSISTRKFSKSKNIDPNVIIRDLVELQIGAPVVHLDFGVGRYQGLQTFEDKNNEFLIISYANDDKIYVPVTSLHLISRYTGSDAEHAPLHSLRGGQWQKEKNKALEKIHDVAIELLEIYAKREARVGHKYTFSDAEYQRFVSGFLFTETKDQTNAIQAIIKDLCSNKPMDRLICGDVGFGKTEVAMRAAFIAAQNAKQVCILSPTTLLADQHFVNFKERFVDFPINIELLSRFRNAKESSKVIQNLQDGKIDILIGTHKILQDDVKFKNLGLLIIDEEHRFGVKQKEYIKKMRAEVDILCMTATPIPRTLNMSMAGIRDISLIASPPAKRLSIKTFWQTRNDPIIKEAILREILRGGQVFFLHNNIQTIEKIYHDLQNLVPEANIRIAHGQMREQELERIMSNFYHQKFNVLLCTTIIETGIDVPSANTIIIDHADKFGLAQLHQLRGRVGRSHHQAYAYLLTPDAKQITKDAKKRLEAIVSLENLGAGFTLATLDMEIRGAGELLGSNQSGNMHAIGFNLYMEMLDKTVNDLKHGKTPELTYNINNGPEIELRMPAIIPEDFISDTHQRLIMYKRISNAKDKQELHNLQVELIDRYGLLPMQIKLLFLVTDLKIAAAKLGISKISLSNNKGCVEFTNNPNINSMELIKLIQTQSNIYKLDGPSKLNFIINASTNEDKINEIKSLLQVLLP